MLSYVLVGVKLYDLSKSLREGCASDQVKVPGRFGRMLVIFLFGPVGGRSVAGRCLAVALPFVALWLGFVEGGARRG